MTGLPPGLGINPVSGLITGTVQAGAYAAGPYAATVTATDAQGYADSVSIYWGIADPVTLTDPGDQSGVEGVPVSLQMQAADTEGYALTYAATGLPTGLSIDSAGLFTGTPAAGAAAGGPYQVTVTATDANGVSADQTFQWNVASPVTVTSVADQSGTEGDQVSLPVAAVDSTGGKPTFTAAGLPAGLTIDSAGLISGTIAAGAAAGGPYQVTVTATDGAYGNSQTFSWDVAQAAPTTAAPPADLGPDDLAALDAVFASLGRTGRNGFDGPAGPDLTLFNNGVNPADQDAPVFGGGVYWPEPSVAPLGGGDRRAGPRPRPDPPRGYGGGRAAY